MYQKAIVTCLFIIYALTNCLYSASSPHLDKSIEKKMVVVIASYNNMDWYKKNLDSVFSQDYENYHIIYVDDASPDGTGSLVEQYIENSDRSQQITLIKNPERRGSLENLYHAIWLCDKDSIIINLDGDDWLSNKHVLSYLNHIYTDSNVWMTYGQFVTFPTYAMGFVKQISTDIITENAYRQRGGGVSHLRTFYAGLFHQIKKEDFLYEGQFLSTAGDAAYVIPLIEMTGVHAKFIPEVLYVYNRSNPINDDKVDRNLQIFLDNYIRQKKSYLPLTERP